MTHYENYLIKHPSVVEDREQMMRLLNSDQLLSIFDAPKKLTEEFLNIDKYIAAKRFYYDNDVYIQTIRHKNSLRG